MNYFRAVHSVVHAAVAGLCWWMVQHIGQIQTELQVWISFQDWIKDYREYAIPAVFAGLVFLFRRSDALSTVIVEKIPGVSRALRRALSGNEFIEGDWPLVVVDMEKLAPLYFGFLKIDFRDGQPSVRGDDWKTDGSHAHAFRSVQSLYHDNMLQYWYEQGQSLHQPDMRGYTEIFFFPRNALAERHAGKFLDSKHTSDIRFYARRRRYGLFERRIAATEDKLAAARDLWAEIAPRLDSLRGRIVGADFA